MEPSVTLQEDSPRGLLQFSLDRVLPEWVPADFSLPVLDLGPGTKLIPGAERLDYPDWDAEHPRSLFKYAAGSVGGVFAINILEHLSDPRVLITEVTRILAPGAPFTIFVPHARSGMYLQDLDHKTAFILDTWKNHVEAHRYYTKGREEVSGSLRVGYNVLAAIKEENVGILTQLIKVEGER